MKIRPEKNTKPDIMDLFGEFEKMRIKGTYPLRSRVDKIIRRNVKFKKISGRKYLASFIPVEGGKDIIELATRNPGDALHEKIHAYLANAGGIDLEKFQIDFDRLRGRYPGLKLINKIIRTDRKNYPKSGDFPEERFAYVAEMYGGKGRNHIPKKLRKYYKDIFRNR